MPDPIHLAELVAARACHDIGSAIGMLAGVVELAGEPAASLAEMGEAALALSRRLELIRAAFGPGGVRLDVPRLRELVRGIPGQERIRLDLAALPEGISFGPGLGRVLLALLLLAPEALPRGGAVVLAAADAHALVVRLQGPRAAWPAGFAAWLGDADAAWDALTSARTLLGPWIALLAPRLGVRLSLLLAVRAGRGAAPLLLRPDPGG